MVNSFQILKVEPTGQKKSPAAFPAVEPFKKNGLPSKHGKPKKSLKKFIPLL